MTRNVPTNSQSQGVNDEQNKNQPKKCNAKEFGQWFFPENIDEQNEQQQNTKQQIEGEYPFERVHFVVSDFNVAFGFRWD